MKEEVGVSLRALGPLIEASNLLSVSEGAMDRENSSRRRSFSANSSQQREEEGLQVRV